MSLLSTLNLPTDFLPGYRLNITLFYAKGMFITRYYTFLSFRIVRLVFLLKNKILYELKEVLGKFLIREETGVVFRGNLSNALKNFLKL